MGAMSHISLMLIVGMLLGLSAGLHWQGVRQLMPATAGVALIVAYVFILTINSGNSVVVGASLAIFAGVATGTTLLIVGRGVSRAEFMLLGLALAEIVRRGAYEFGSVTGGANGLQLTNITLVSPVFAFVVETSIIIIVLLAIQQVARTPLGMSVRLAGASPRAARLLGINVNRLEIVCAALAGAASSGAGILYVIMIQYIHPDDFGMSLGLSALVIGIAVRPRHATMDIIILSFILFGLREVLRFVGTGTNRFAGHDILIGALLVAVAIRLGRKSDTENEEQWAWN